MSALPAGPTGLQIRTIAAAELPAAQALLIAGGWSARAADLARFRELVARSTIARVAVLDQQVVGFVRGLSDGLSNGYLSMLVVAESRRRQGIGAALVRDCIGDNPGITWVLRAGRPGLIGFYERLGFRVSEVAMERPRRDPGGTDSAAADR